MRMNRTLRSVLTVVSCIGLASCSGGKQADTEPVLRPVRAEQVFSTGAARERTFSGVARASVEARISFKVGGTVERVFVKVGDEIGVGESIAQLDATDRRLQLEDAQASLTQAKAQERNASAEYERVRGLYENRNASKQDLDGARTAFESANASVESITKRLELAQRQLDYCRLDAPVAGSIASVEVEVNENVSAGQTICLLTAGSDLEVEVAIPEALIGDVREGDPVAIEFDALANRRFPGHITEVGVAATGIATTFPVTVRLDRADHDVLSGMAAEVTFSFGGGDGAERMIVDTFAVSEDRRGRFVWVVTAAGDGEGVVQRRDVTIGELTGGGLEVTSGLSDGEYVVTAGVSKLADGQRVRFTPAGEE